MILIFCLIDKKDNIKPIISNDNDINEIELGVAIFFVYLKYLINFVCIKVCVVGNARNFCLIILFSDCIAVIFVILCVCDGLLLFLLNHYCCFIIVV